MSLEMLVWIAAAGIIGFALGRLRSLKVSRCDRSH